MAFDRLIKNAIKDATGVNVGNNRRGGLGKTLTGAVLGAGAVVAANKLMENKDQAAQGGQFQQPGQPQLQQQGFAPGYAQAAVCANCGAGLAPGTKFCNSCGAPVAAAPAPAPAPMATAPACANCGAELAEGVRFCVSCGTPVAAAPAPAPAPMAAAPVCANCGAELAEGVRFCVSCGTPVA